MSQSQTGPSTWALFNTFAAQASGLFQTELRLVRAEIGENLLAAARAAACLAGALVLALAGFVILLEACVGGLVAAGLAAHWAGLIVAAVAFAAVALLVKIALGNLTPARLMPVRSFAQMGKDLDLLKGKAE